MPVDFSKLVLAPCQNVFARAIIIDPLASQAGERPYPARGIFTSRHVDVVMSDGAVLSDQQTTLDIRISEFETAPPAGFTLGGAPMKGDFATLNDDVGSPPSGTRYFIGDIQPDGQGGLQLILRLVVPTSPPL